jgi:hypothetical protein
LYFFGLSRVPSLEFLYQPTKILWEIFAWFKDLWVGSASASPLPTPKNVTKKIKHIFSYNNNTCRRHAETYRRHAGDMQKLVRYSWINEKVDFHYSSNTNFVHTFKIPDNNFNNIPV